MSSFVLVSSHVGPLIVNARDDGVGNQVLATGTHEPEVIQLGCLILDEKRKLRGDGVHALDVGANIGTCTMGWANHMAGWGTVTAFEPQERVYYALAGGVALNNAMNARAINAAVTAKSGMMKIPTLNHNAAANFGGLSLIPDVQVEPGQAVSFEEKDMVDVQAIALDDVAGRVDFIKIDVEGMEPHVLEGALELIAREKPIIAAEFLHCGPYKIREKLPDYLHLLINYNVYLVHPDDRVIFDLLKSKIT
jgi:FkbM family methyltransferase